METYMENGHPILTDFASVFPGGKRPNLHPDRHNFPTKGKTVAQRMENYVKLCKRTGKDLTSEPGGAGELEGAYWDSMSQGYRPADPVPYADSIILRSCSSWARFVMNEDSEREQLGGDTAKALEFWAMVRAELATGR